MSYKKLYEAIKFLKSNICRSVKKFSTLRTANLAKTNRKKYTVTFTGEKTQDVFRAFTDKKAFFPRDIKTKKNKNLFMF